MSVKMEKIENNTAKLEISVPAADFKKAVDKSYHNRSSIYQDLEKAKHQKL